MPSVVPRVPNPARARRRGRAWSGVWRRRAKPSGPGGDVLRAAHASEPAPAVGRVGLDGPAALLEDLGEEEEGAVVVEAPDKAAQPLAHGGKAALAREADVDAGELESPDVVQRGSDEGGHPLLAQGAPEWNRPCEGWLEDSSAGPHGLHRGSGRAGARGGGESST